MRIMEQANLFKSEDPSQDVTAKPVDPETAAYLQ